jgi:hypothetical protein
MAYAGGPLAVTGPVATVSGQPFIWNPAAMPVHYFVDGGPMAKDPSGKVVIDHNTGLSRIQGMFQNWQNVATSSLTYTYAGGINAPGLSSDGDVDTLAEFNSVVGVCNSGTQNPIMFDSNGTLLRALGYDPLIIGFAGFCKVDSTAGHILSALVFLNGEFQDGVSNFTTYNYELTANQFDEAITHEIGHFSGLDHSQINVEIFGQPVGTCSLDDLAGLPLMFPFAYCQDRKSVGLPVVSNDDAVWISRLYPKSTFDNNYGTIRGNIYFSDGVTHVQGLNVIARAVDDPSTPQDESKRVAVSVVSGFLFTGNPGQSVSGTNTGGDPNGSRDPSLVGYYEISVPPGTYTVQVENIDASFVGGSSVGPLDPPAITYGAFEFWHQYESDHDDPQHKDAITVAPGQFINGINIILNGTSPRFDIYEDGGA